MLVLATDPSAEQMLEALSAHVADYRACEAVQREPGPYCRLIARICSEPAVAEQSQGGGPRWEPGHLAGRSPVFLEALAAAARVAREETILLCGETGAGKSFLARTIVSALNPERGERFEHVDCGAIAESLSEGELFGWEANTFTGTGGTGRRGFFERADGGVLFLDEIGHLSLAQQQALLIVLDSGAKNPFVRKVRKIGGASTEVDVQVIAAT